QDPGYMMLGCVQHPRAPSATHVENSISLLHSKFPANVVEHLRLCRLQVVVRSSEVPTRRRHTSTKKQGVELIRQVGVGVPMDILRNVSRPNHPRRHHPFFLLPTMRFLRAKPIENRCTAARS